METLGKYLLGCVGIAAVTVLVLYGDPSRAKEWGPIGTAVIAAYVAWQQRQTQAVLKQQDAHSNAREQKLDAVAVQVEKVHEDVNSGAARALDTQSTEAYARGTKDTIEALQPAIVAAVAAERAAGEVARDR